MLLTTFVLCMMIVPSLVIGLSSSKMKILTSLWASIKSDKTDFFTSKYKKTGKENLMFPHCYREASPLDGKGSEDPRASSDSNKNRRVTISLVCLLVKPR